MTDGLFSVLMSLRKIPNIRYLGRSEACKKLSYDLHVILFFQIILI